VRIWFAQLRAAKVSNPILEEKSGNSADISKGISKTGMCEFESSQVSQAVRTTPFRPQLIGEKPTDGGLLQSGLRSPDSQFPELSAGYAQSLWPFIE
jgi:hypothetical protein